MRHTSLWIALAVSPALAEIIPATPTEDQIFRTGDECTISWDADNTPGGWKSMRIDLMSGSPPGIAVLENVVESVGSTGSDPDSYTWTCPMVDFDGPVYSYMFTPNDSIDPPEYSSQFTITGFSGSLEIPGAASISVSISTTTTDAELYEPTGVADPSQGAIHLGHAPDSGEQMLEDIPTQLGGSDSKPTGSVPPDFLAQGLQTPGTQKDQQDDQQADDTSDGATGVPQNGAKPGSAIIATAIAAAANGVPSVDPSNVAAASLLGTTSVRRPTASSSASPTSSSSSTSRTEISSVDQSLRHKDGLVRALFFAICVGHFVL